MKIIKIIHTRPQGEAEAEPQRILAYGYDIDTFVERNRESIFQAVHAQKHLPQVAWNDVGSLVRGATALGTVYQRYHDTLMKFTVELFLRDLRDQLTHLEVISLEIAKEKYSRSTNLPIGTYTLHPFDSQRLVSIEHYHQNLALEKDHELVFLLGRMGAKILRIVEVDEQGNKRAGKLEMKAIKAGKGGAELTHKVSQGKELVVKFEGNSIDIEPELLDKSLWFSNDGLLRTLFESRVSSPNKIRDYTHINTYTETYDFDFDLAAKYLFFKADLRAEYLSLRRKTRLFHVEFN